jgi:hypothetical protein
LTSPGPLLFFPHSKLSLVTFILHDPFFLFFCIINHFQAGPLVPWRSRQCVSLKCW